MNHGWKKNPHHGPKERTHNFVTSFFWGFCATFCAVLCYAGHKQRSIINHWSFGLLATMTEYLGISVDSWSIDHFLSHRFFQSDLSFKWFKLKNPNPTTTHLSRRSCTWMHQRQVKLIGPAHPAAASTALKTLNRTHSQYQDQNQDRREPGTQPH